MATRLRLLAVPLALAAACWQAGAAAAAPPPASISVKVTGLKHGRAPILGRVTVKGALSPATAGEQVTVRLLQRGHVAQSRTVTPSGSGAFSVPFKIDDDGGWRAEAVHDASPALGGAAARSGPFDTLYPQLHSGSHGAAVKLFNRLLQRKGYLASDSGRYTAVTGRGVMAFRKVNGMRRTSGTATPQMFRTLMRGGGGYTVHHPDAGRHAEVSLRRQVLVLANGGDVFRIYHVSTGAPSTPTIRGAFKFYRREPGFNSKGMFDSFYFHGGYAVHGYKDVPPYPASHGCVRTPIPDQRGIYGWLQMGDPIFIQ